MLLYTKINKTGEPTWCCVFKNLFTQYFNSSSNCSLWKHACKHFILVVDWARLADSPGDKLLWAFLFPLAAPNYIKGVATWNGLCCHTLGSAHGRSSDAHKIHFHLSAWSLCEGEVDIHPFVHAFHIHLDCSSVLIMAEMGVGGRLEEVVRDAALKLQSHLFVYICLKWQLICNCPVCTSLFIGLIIHLWVWQVLPVSAIVILPSSLLLLFQPLPLSCLHSRIGSHWPLPPAHLISSWPLLQPCRIWPRWDECVHTLLTALHTSQTQLSSTYVIPWSAVCCNSCMYLLGAYTHSHWTVLRLDRCTANCHLNHHCMQTIANYAAKNVMNLKFHALFQQPKHGLHPQPKHVRQLY